MFSSFRYNIYYYIDVIVVVAAAAFSIFFIRSNSQTNLQP